MTGYYYSVSPSQWVKVHAFMAHEIWLGPLKTIEFRSACGMKLKKSRPVLANGRGDLLARVTCDNCRRKIVRL